DTPDGSSRDPDWVGSAEATSPHPGYSRAGRARLRADPGSQRQNYALRRYTPSPRPESGRAPSVGHAPGAAAARDRAATAAAAPGAAPLCSAATSATIRWLAGRAPRLYARRQAESAPPDSGTP